MSVRINTNVDANEVQRNVQLALQRFSTAVQRLSTGIRINSASDDAAGLAISEELITQIKGFDQAERNALDAVSLAQTGEKALSTTSAMLQRMRQLAVQAANDTYTMSDRQDLQAEVTQLISEIDRISAQTDFNTKKLLDGSAGGATVEGGGGIIDGISAQGDVAVSRQFTLLQARNATRSATESLGFSGVTMMGSFFTQESSITIQGGRGTQTFTAHPGESLEEWFQEVNGSGIGVTMSMDTINQPGTSAIMIANKDMGTNIAGLGNPTGPNTAAVVDATGDFADKGLTLAFAITGLGVVANQFAIDERGVSIAGQAQNAQITIQNPNLTQQVLTGQGPNSENFEGSGISAGILIRVTDPGNLVGQNPFVFQGAGSTFTVTNNPTLKFHVGANADQVIGFGIDATTSLALGVGDTSVLTHDDAEQAITHLDSAIQQVAAIRATIGATINRLTNSVKNDSSAFVQASASNSRIRDVNFARETVELTAIQIRLGAGIGVLAKANQSPRGVLGLLR